jgi:aquaporin Z
LRHNRPHHRSEREAPPATPLHRTHVASRQLFQVGGWALGQLWLFWIAPIVGAMLGAVTWRFVASDEI